MTAIAMVAGEASGDLLAADLVRAIRASRADCALLGIGGARMVASGFDAWYSSELLSVRGYAEALPALPRLFRLRRELARRLIERRPDLFVGIDAPDFNLGLAARLKRAGLRTAHFISPSIWAWRGGRIDQIRSAVGHMLTVFPFEEQLYRDAGIPATYVGHPLADQIALIPDRAAARAALAVEPAARLVALLPGSRASEIKYMAQTFFDCAYWLAAQDRSLQFVVPVATPSLRAALAEKLDVTARRARAETGSAASGLRIELVDGHSHTALAACDAALVASGTATLEAALFKRPMVIAYKLAPSTAWLMRRLAYVKWVGLPNILCGEALVPELLQADATAPALGKALLEQMNDPKRIDYLNARFTELHQRLKRDCARVAGDKLLELVDGR